MSQENQATSDVAVEIAAQAAAATERRKKTQGVAKRVVERNAFIKRLHATISAAWDGIKEKPYWDVNGNKKVRMSKEDFATAPKVVAMRRQIQDAEDEISFLKRGDGTLEYAASLRVALCFEKMRAEEKPSEATVRQFADEVAILACLVKRDAEQAKKENGWKYPFGSVVFHDLCLVPNPKHLVDGRQSKTAHGLCEEFRKLTRRYYAAEHAAKEKDIQLLLKSDASKDLQGLLDGKPGSYLIFSEGVGETGHVYGRGVGVIGVYPDKYNPDMLQIYAKDGTGSLAWMKKLAEYGFLMRQEFLYKEKLPGSLRGNRPMQKMHGVIRTALARFDLRKRAEAGQKKAETAIAAK
jgi:hypothetical protein